MAKRTSKGEGHKVSDPREKLASTANKEKDPKKFDRGQQLSDKYINMVAKKRMTYDEAKKKQADDDNKVSKNITTRGGRSISNDGANSVTRKAKHRLDNKGRKTSY